MDMSTRSNRYHAFLLRLLQTSHNLEKTWHASLEDSHSGEKHGFASLEDLMEYLRRLTREKEAEEPDVE
jgi:hypothetical protein